MGKFILASVALLVLVIIGGIAFLSLWDIPAPATRVERVIPDARFPR